MAGRVLVTGATGFLGGALVHRLRREGWSVTAIGRDPERLARLQEDGFACIAADLTLPLAAEDRARVQDVDTIIHCAARSTPHGAPSAFERANVTATRHLADLAQALGIPRFLFISSSSVNFAPADQLGVRENDPLPPPFNAYADSKQRAEHLVLERLPQAIILRPRGIYGVGDTALLPRLLRAARRGPLPLLRDGRARIDLTHVDDVVASILSSLHCSENAEGRVYNVSGGEVLPIREIVERACQRAGVTPRWRRLPLRPLMAMAGGAEAACRLLPGDVEPPVTRYGLALFAFAQSLDLSRARSELGWAPAIDFERGLDLTFSPGTRR